MAPPKLGRLARVDLRTAWKSEATSFTPWLAHSDNLSLLSETLGLGEEGLEVQGQEQSVGPFRADILCRNTNDNALVLIENQLERTDHTHLGQLLTYAAGLKAVTLVWIAERFTEEHRAALNWLNEITDETFHFFGLEVELWKIGDSAPAPKFNIVAQPNDWSRIAQKSSQSTGTTPMGQLQVAYWAAFGEHLKQQHAPLKPPKPYPSNWMNWGLGRAGISLMAFVNARHVAVGIGVNAREHPTWFSQLAVHKDAIYAQTGIDLVWDEKPNQKFASLRARYELDMRDETNWPTAHTWLCDGLLALRNAFRPLVKHLHDNVSS